MSQRPVDGGRPHRGHVTLVGAGPGDPGLLTVSGKRAIERADVVLYDRLASPALLATLPVDGQERIHVGKTAGPGHVQQAHINALLVKRALAGQRVVRLKGGDPFVLGRGGEEAQACVTAGVSFDVVPGVSSAVAGPAFAGIPVTHRDVASGFSVLTGHERADGVYERVDWTNVAGHGGTVVVLMGVLHVARWSAGLIAGGRDPQTPVALVRWATTPRQSVLTSTLRDVAAAVSEAGLRPPAVAVVGDVVKLRETLAWAEDRPLFGETIALTRSPGASRSERSTLSHDGVAHSLSDAGACVLHLPLTCQSALPDTADECVAGLATASDVVFTSANGVRYFAIALLEAGHDSRALAGRVVWAVGPATAAALKETLGVVADHVSTPHSADGLVALAAALGVGEGRHFLFPAAAAARPNLKVGLVALGAEVTQLGLYETTASPGLATSLADALEAGLTTVCLASPSAADALADAMAELGADPADVAVAVIGPTTAAHAQARGLKVSVIAANATMVGLVDALVEHGRGGVVATPAL